LKNIFYQGVTIPDFLKYSVHNKKKKIIAKTRKNLNVDFDSQELYLTISRPEEANSRIIDFELKKEELYKV